MAQGHEKIAVLASDIELQILANQATIMCALYPLIHSTDNPLRQLLGRRISETNRIAEEQRKIRGL